MRTTLTLDDDIAAKLQSAVRKTGKPFKQVVNELLRMALSAPGSRKNVPPFRVKARWMGHRPGLNYDCVGELIEQLEGPLHR